MTDEAHAAAPARPTDPKPNFIIILADDLGYGDVGCYGGQDVATPHLDALARRGMRFTDFHSNGAVCSPTRAALLTGRYQQRCGIEAVITAAGHRDVGMDLKEVTFAEVLKPAGYATGLFGKWHLGYAVEFNPIRQGFDEFRGFVSGNVDYHSHIDQAGYQDWWIGEKLTDEKGYTTDLITAHGVEFLERHKDGPFCLYLAHECPHGPYQGRNDPPERSPKGSPAPKGPRPDRQAAYRQMIAAMDEGVGRIVQTLERLGLDSRTLVFFFSDNGPAGPGLAGPLRGQKNTLWEGGHRVPAIACWPGRVPAGATCHEQAMGMDLLATMASLAGAGLPDGLQLDGVDLSGVLMGRAKLPERPLFWRHGNQKAIRKGPWKLLVTAPAVGKAKGAPPPGAQGSADDVALFHLADDLGEMRNLAADQADRAKAMLAELEAWERDISAGVTRRT